MACVLTVATSHAPLMPFSSGGLGSSENTK